LFAARDARSRVLYDLDGNPITYDELAAKADGQLVKRMAPEVWREQYQATQRAFDALSLTIERTAPDILVIMGDDEEEIHHDDNRPAIMVFAGESVRVKERTLAADADELTRLTNWSWGVGDRTYPVATDLAEHLIERLILDDFDISYSRRLPENEGISHGFGFVYTRLATASPIPCVPLFVNIHYPPNQLTPVRCYRLGQAVRRAVESWYEDARVAVIGTGGLSTGVLREDMDRLVLNAMRTHDVDALARMPRKWIKGPTGEVLAWISTAGACEHLQMDLLDYIPAVRSPAGTGWGMAFARWLPTSDES
jgi:hypothetical protein